MDGVIRWCGYCGGLGYVTIEVYPKLRVYVACPLCRDQKPTPPAGR